MATPAEIASLSSCFKCVSDFEAGLLYLLAVNAGIMDPATIAANSVCYKCVPDWKSAVLYLLDNGGSGGGGGGASDFFVTTGTGPPASSPAGTSRWYVDLSNGATYYSDGVVWTLKS